MQLFLGLLVLLLLLYLLNFLDESKMWKLVDACQRSSVFLSPHDFEQKDIEVVNYSPCILAIHELLTPLEQDQIHCLGSGMLQALPVAVLAAPNHRLIQVIQKRVSVLTSQKLHQVHSLEMALDGNDLQDLSYTPLCTLIIFLSTEGCIDFPQQGITVSAVPGLALWWYHVQPDGQVEPIQCTFPEPGTVLRIQVSMKPVW